MKRNLFGAIFFIWALLATPAYASVIMNEIAWMGTTDSSTNEWIELYNEDAHVVDLSGWKIVADDGSPSIALSGTISANGYFLIERTDDTTVPGVTADLIAAFGSGLSNSGETLRLLNTNGVSVDTVIGGVDWVNIGGNNITKETAQRTTGGWITGTSTPRAQNVAQASVVLDTNTNTNTTINTGTSGDSLVPSKSTMATTPTKTTVSSEIFPRKDIVVLAGDDKNVFALFPVTFNGSATGLYGESLDTATYRWNFGDGAIGAGKTTSHVYEFPGEYVVTLEVFWSTYRRTDRLSVIAVMPDVVISKIVAGDNGYIELLNRANREIDLSEWTITTSSGSVAFAFPPNSIILPKKTFLLANHLSHFRDIETDLSLHFPDGKIIFTMATATPQSAEVNAGQHTTVTSAASLVPLSHTKTYEGESVSKINDIQKVSSPNGATNTAETVLWKKNPAELGASLASRGYEIDGGSKWLLVLLGIILLILAGFIIAQSHRGDVTIADEYAIIEDIIEGREDLK